ncbi:hypothetical protein Aab01nite_38690 [Paractinoplanes abujensis]|uniref:Pyridoxamine 5'-phosphate oxidase N-terminal domain-containing protein n=1 Tax=Paractinoplanes abujensis TaxID=882441 RepID=A0A7W7G1T1_9ACTN|nr:pyridoxamine 5'-phosphate oxidase family protein [Actinoplanes abujensis]MBB4694508.1 hypothetical protein [Actinoplanes abujensis]GID20279.1 hypothetical protein Aab01nite_38690 [Actinoplanes abujensis]
MRSEHEPGGPRVAPILQDRARPPGFAAGALPLATWPDTCELLRSGDAGPFWLSVTRAGAAPHVRPIFAAWDTGTFFFVSKESAAKTHHFTQHPQVSLSVDLKTLHLVVEGRVTRAADLQRASTALREVFGWPTVVRDDQLDAEGGAPTSGGPPYEVWQLAPARAYAFPTHDQFDPTRWTFTDPA